MPSRQQQIRKFIQNQNASHQVVVWSKSYCPYCASTKKLFRGLPNLDIVIHEIDEHPQGYLIQQELHKISGQRTVPNVFVNGTHVGGNDKVQEAFRNGKLQDMLSEVYQKLSIKSFIEKENSSHDVVVWSKSYCPYCAATKKLLASLPVGDVIVHELDRDPQGQQIQQELAKMTNQFTVPNVFVNNRHLGGNDAVQKANQSGSLAHEFASLSVK